MRLTFSILWFDDNESWLDSLDLSGVEAEITKLGFIPEIIKTHSAEEFVSHQPYKKFDLIVIDYLIEKDQEEIEATTLYGQDFIEKVRGHQVFADIIFYSTNAVSNLWDAIRERELEGIYVESRDFVREKIIKVGTQIVHKVLDLENMRGIVMAEVGDLDLQLNEILKRGIATLPDSKKFSFFKKFIEGIDKQVATHNEKLEKFRGEHTIEDFLELCDSNKRWEGVHRLIKNHKQLEGMN